MRVKAEESRIEEDGVDFKSLDYEEGMRSEDVDLRGIKA